MGGIFSRARAANSRLAKYSEQLDTLSEEISALEASRATLHQKKRSTQVRLLIYGLLVWILVSTLCYFYVPPKRTNQYLLLRSAPPILIPILLWILKHIIDWLYVRAMKRNEATMVKLTKEKEKMLDEIVESTNYKATAELLAKHNRTLGTPLPSRTQSMTNSNNNINPSDNSKQADLLLSQQKLQGGQKPVQQLSMATPLKQPAPHHPTPSHNPSHLNTPAAVKLPAPLPSDLLRVQPRTKLDKVLDFMLGDGPNNRYALICPKCFTHNGLVREQDINIRYRCNLCHHLNGPPLPAGWQPPVPATPGAAMSIPATPLHRTPLPPHMMAHMQQQQQLQLQQQQQQMNMTEKKHLPSHCAPVHEEVDLEEKETTQSKHEHSESPTVARTLLFAEKDNQDFTQKSTEQEEVDEENDDTKTEAQSEVADEVDDESITQAETTTDKKAANEVESEHEVEAETEKEPVAEKSDSKGLRTRRGKKAMRD